MTRDDDSDPQRGDDARSALAGSSGSAVPDAPGVAAGDDREAAGPPSDGERMARDLVRDIAAYEVDPPPPARADPAS